MLEDYLKVMGLIKEAGEIRTRKRVQKLVYLLQQRGAPFNEHFGLNYYGPYSNELQIELDQLQEANLIDQKFEEGSYFYRLQNSVKNLLKKKNHR